MTYIGIEGSSYVGKTTTIERLGSRGYSVVPEYDQFGPFPESDNSFEGLSSVVEHLVGLERRRTSLLESFAVHKNIFSDRTPISFLTFEDMKSLTARTSDQREIHARTSDYAKARLISEISKGNIILPEGIAVMELSEKRSFESRVRRRGITSVSELARFGIQKYIANRTVEYAAELIGSSSTTLVKADGIDADELADNMIDFASKISEKSGEWTK